MMGMSTAGAKRHPWRDKRPRSLREAARAARDVAAAEQLPIHATTTGDPVRWHAEAMLKTIAVHGARDGLCAVMDRSGALELDAELQSADGWRDLTVERPEFDAYLAWLRSVW